MFEMKWIQSSKDECGEYCWLKLLILTSEGELVFLTDVCQNQWSVEHRFEVDHFQIGDLNFDLLAIEKSKSKD